jgi:hypothetical protein
VGGAFCFSALRRTHGGARRGARGAQDGYTPLYAAAQKGHDAVVARLLAAGAAVDAKMQACPGRGTSVRVHTHTR